MYPIKDAGKDLTFNTVREDIGNTKMTVLLSNITVGDLVMSSVETTVIDVHVPPDKPVMVQFYNG